MSGEVVDPTLDGQAPRLVMSLRDLVGVELDGRYQLRKVLGEGAMGVVFRATQRSVGRDVAVKLLKMEQFRSQDSYERFQREMSIIGSLKHPNVVSLLDSGRDERLGVFYIVMELVEGISLGDLIYEPPRPMRVELALEIIYQVCAALTEPHRRGIIHRDIKPDNVLLMPMADDTVQVKVVDFGVARAADGQDRVTATGVVVGTPAYMAPELCQASAIGPTTDLYAVGAMLFELITGAVPFEANTSMAVILKHIQEPPPLLTSKLKGEFPYPELVHLVQQLLGKRPQDRPATALDVRERIDEIRERYQMKRVRVDGGSPARRAFEPWLLVSNPARQSQYRSAEVVPTTTLISAPGDDPLEQLKTQERAAPEDDALRATPDRGATSIGAAAPALLTQPMMADERAPDAPPRASMMAALAALGVLAVLIAGGVALKIAMSPPAQPAQEPVAPIAAPQDQAPIAAPATPQDPAPRDQDPVAAPSAEPAQAQLAPVDASPTDPAPSKIKKGARSKPEPRVEQAPKVEPKVEPPVEPAKSKYEQRADDILNN